MLPHQALHVFRKASAALQCFGAQQRVLREIDVVVLVEQGQFILQGAGQLFDAHGMQKCRHRQRGQRVRRQLEPATDCGGNDGSVEGLGRPQLPGVSRRPDPRGDQGTATGMLEDGTREVRGDILSPEVDFHDPVCRSLVHRDTPTNNSIYQLLAGF